MKHFFYTLALSLLSFSLFSQQKTETKPSQNNPGTKEVLASSPERQAVLRTKNENSTSLIVNGITIDKRATAYYSEEDLKDISAQKAIKMNHIYVDSFEITDKKNLSSNCQELLQKEFDLGPYNHLRKKDSRVIIPVNFKGCSFTISLFSWDEIDQLK